VCAKNKKSRPEVTRDPYQNSNALTQQPLNTTNGNRSYPHHIVLRGCPYSRDVYLLVCTAPNHEGQGIAGRRQGQNHPERCRSRSRSTEEKQNPRSKGTIP